MEKKNTNSDFQRDTYKREKNSKNKIIIIFLGLLLVVSSFGLIRGIGHEEEIEKTEIVNIIEQNTSVNYFANVNPSILYPEGGRIIPDNAIFTNLTEDLIVDLNINVNSQHPIEIDGTSQVLLRILASDTWQRDAVLIAKSPISLSNSSTIIDEEINININQIQSFISAVEQETLVRPGNYQLQIIPITTGDILNEDGIVIGSANNEVVIPFEMNSQYLKYVAEEQKKDFVNKTEIKNTSVINQEFSLFGLGMSKKNSILIFSFLSLASLISIALLLKNTFSNESKDEEKKLKKKYAVQMANISKDTIFDNNIQIILTDFKSLIKISEDKEEPILKKENIEENQVHYYVMGLNHIYTYKSENKPKN